MRSARSRGALLTTALSIVFAVILWMVAIDRRTFEVVETVPIVPPPLPDSLVILEPLQAAAESITFSGRGTDMLRDQLRGRPASVSLGTAREAVQGPWPVTVQYVISAADITWNGTPFANLTVKAFGPSTIQLQVDRSQTVPVPVKVISSGPVPARFFWARCAPVMGDGQLEAVDVTGAASVVQSLDSVRTLPILPGQPGETASGFEPIPSVTGFAPATIRASLIRPVQIVSLDDI